MSSSKDSCSQSDSDKYDSLNDSSKDSSSNLSYPLTNSSSYSFVSSSCDTKKSSDSCTTCDSSSTKSCDSSSTCSTCDSATSSCSLCSDSKSVSCSDSRSDCSKTCSDSCTTSASSSDCSKTCSDSCMDCDDSCYNPDRRIPCPEDCPKKCKPFNIYWFGSSCTDSGNGRLNMGLKPYNVNTQDLDECGVVSDAMGPCAKASDGKVYPQFVAEDLCMNLDLEYDICALPKEKNYLVSFAISGAMQTGNTTPLVPEGDFGYDWQIAKYLELYNKSKCYAIPEKDIFMYTDVGKTDLIYLMNLYLDGNAVDINMYFQNYVNQAYKNVVDLYNSGKSRRMFVQLIDAGTIVQTPFFQEYSCALGQVTDLIMAAYDNAQSELANLLETFAENLLHFDLTVLTSSTMYEELSNNATVYGIVVGKTMVELGWPDKIFSNQLWFDSFHLTSHSNRIVANYVKTWFQQRVCNDCDTGCC